MGDFWSRVARVLEDQPLKQLHADKFAWKKHKTDSFRCIGLDWFMGSVIYVHIAFKIRITLRMDYRKN